MVLSMMSESLTHILLSQTALSESRHGFRLSSDQLIKPSGGHKCKKKKKVNVQDCFNVSCMIMWASKKARPHVHTLRTKHPCNAIGNIFFPSEMQLILQNKAEVTPSVCRISVKPLKLNNTTPESLWWNRPGCLRHKTALIGHRPVSAPHASTGNAEEAAH